MQIFEQKVFRFVFPFLGQEAVFNVVAETQPEAAQKIIQWMLSTMDELSMAFPKIAPVAFPKIAPVEVPVTKQPAMEELRIVTLVEELSKFLTRGNDLDATILDWCKVENRPENYPAIINGLEDLKKNYETGKIRKAGR